MESFTEYLLLEIERAIRAKSIFVILVYNISQADESQKVKINQLKKDLLDLLRRVDNAFAFSNRIVLLLPYTKKDGLNTVKEKISPAFKKNGLLLDGQEETKIFLFPNDVPEELIKTYNNDGIKDLVLNVLF